MEAAATGVVSVEGPAAAEPAGGLVDRALGRAVEGLAAALVVAEIAVLLCGVVSRYVLESPLVWSDELAETLFIWLAMLSRLVWTSQRMAGVIRLA